MKLLLRNNQCPGDVLMLTAAVRDLHRAHPGRFLTALETTCPELWENNPHVTPAEELGEPERVIDCEYPLIHESNRRPFHFIHGFVQDLERKLAVPIPIGEFRGDLHLSEAEKRMPSPVESAGHRGAYWVMVCGGKFDFTTKWWNPDWFQAVVDHFGDRIQFVQCGGAGHAHSPLRDVVDLVGKTSVRELVRVIYHAEGVVCPVTFAMHVAAAVPPRLGKPGAKPCVVIAGGREPPSWEAYPTHQFLHTVGALDCCASGGCWKSRCLPLGDGDLKDHALCVHPVRVRDDLQIARCMTLITPQKVIDAIELYERGRSCHSPALAQAESSVEIDVKPRGVAVTIGTGGFARLAALAAREVRSMTGLDTVVLDDNQMADSGLECACFLKFRLFDLVPAENILYFDADQVCLGRWDPRPLFGQDAVVAVRDRMGGLLSDEAREWGIPPELYFNAGMFIANRSHHHRWLRKAESIRFLHPTALQDQSPMNLARHELGIPLKMLDRRFNWLGFGASSLSLEMPVVMAHKLVPHRVDLNEAYLEGRYDLLAPQIVVDETETARLAGRTFDLWENQTIDQTIHFREDGTLLPIAEGDEPGYWFVHEHNGRATLALASETRLVWQFIETLGGQWVSTDADDRRLVHHGAGGELPLTETNARPVADRFLEALGSYPDGACRGRGIVICGGGERYLPCAWVCIRMLRHLGCRLPVELWQLRESEISEPMRQRLSPLGVTCVNAAEVRRTHPVRFLSGWELKPYSILHSSFEQVLYLDADNVAVRDPTFLLDCDEIRSSGAVFWPDYGRLAEDREIWRICGVSYRDEPEFESGQMVIDKRRCWRPLQLAMHLNAHSDFYYRYIHGDKETFHMAWRMCGREYAQVPHPIHSLSHAMCQHDFAGRRLFQHRNRAKWSVRGPNRRVEDFWHEERCLGYLEELADDGICSSGRVVALGAVTA